MASFEMEPVFCKALKLLYSSAKDSSDELMHLLEEAIEQKYGGTKTLNLRSGVPVEESSKTLDVSKSSRLSRGSSPIQSNPVGHTSEKSSRDSSPPSEPVSSRTSPDLDEELALEIFEDDLNCKICKGMSVGPRNRLVECSDCHMLYHQECHKPPISENVNDPRLVWYCSICTKKTQEKVQSKIKNVHVDSSQKKSKTEILPETKSSAFKRNDKSSSSSHSKSSTSSSLSHLGTSLQGSKTSSSGVTSSSKHHSTSSGSNTKSSSSFSNSKTPSSPNQKPQAGPAPAPANIIAADKRLQNMKKKAAAKMQEKRTKHK